MRSLVLLSCLLAAAIASSRSYDGYSVFRTGKLNATTAKFLREVQMSSNLIDFWTEPAPGRRTDLMVSDKMSEETMKMLTDNHIHFHTMIQDVQNLIEDNDAIAKKMKKNKKKNKMVKKDYDLDWDDYYDHDTLNQFLDALAGANDWANVINIGKSYEGRDMNVLAITKAGPGAPSVWLEAGIHAREWIAPAVATFLVRELVEKNDDHPDYIDKLNWYFLPSANPDGYQYSRDHDRMWRKTRSPTGSIFGCKGVDPNRNWGYHWGESGVSNDKCSDIYPGAEAFSEI
jgi:murein tripeptide amidase MpaA